MSDKLSAKQKQVVRWLVENGHEDEPIEACHAKLVSQYTLYSHWGVDNVRAWCADLKKSTEKSGPTKSDVQDALREMVPDALNLIHTVLTRGKGDRSAVTVAQWILREAFLPVVEEKEAEPLMTKAEQELDNLVRASFGGR